MAVVQLIVWSITSTYVCAGKLMWLTLFVAEKKKAQTKEHKKASK